MSLDPRTPVLVGVGAITEQIDDPREASEPLDLMAAALERALGDGEEPTLLEDLRRDLGLADAGQR